MVLNKWTLEKGLDAFEWILVEEADRFFSWILYLPYFVLPGWTGYKHLRKCM